LFLFSIHGVTRSAGWVTKNAGLGVEGLDLLFLFFSFGKATSLGAGLLPKGLDSGTMGAT
jgi:hypothetical protein